MSGLLDQCTDYWIYSVVNLYGYSFIITFRISDPLQTRETSLPIYPFPICVSQPIKERKLNHQSTIMEAPLDLRITSKGDTGNLPDWVKRELLPIKNFPDQIVDHSFLRAINGSLRGRYVNSINVNFDYSDYKDIPTSFPVDVKTMIDFAKVNNLNLHLYMYEKIAENSEGLGKGGRVYSIYNSKTEGRRVFLLLHNDREFPIRNPFKLLRPQLKSPRPVYCYRCGTTFADSLRRNKHYDNCKSPTRGSFYDEATLVALPNRLSLPQKVITIYL
jgi:hypothetical protein